MQIFHVTPELFFVFDPRCFCTSTICGWIRIPGSPMLACLARLLISGAFSQMVAVEGKDELEGVVSFMLGQALMVVASALQRVLWHASEAVDGRSSFLAEQTAPAPARATEVPAQPVASPQSASSVVPALPLQPLCKDSQPARSLLSRALLSISDVQSIFSLVLPVLQMMQTKAARGDAAAAAAELAEESLAAGLRRTMISKSALVSLVERSIS
jgi:hypothetical protein